MDRKKELLRAARAAQPVGGVYTITNTRSGRVFIDSTQNIKGAGNLFQFSVSTGGCPKSALKADWDACGADAFAYAECERLEKKPEQTTAQFRDDLSTLLSMWRERMAGTDFYA